MDTLASVPPGGQERDRGSLLEAMGSCGSEGHVAHGENRWVHRVTPGQEEHWWLRESVSLSPWVYISLSVGQIRCFPMLQVGPHPNRSHLSSGYTDRPLCSSISTCHYFEFYGTCACLPLLPPQSGTGSERDGFFFYPLILLAFWMLTVKPPPATILVNGKGSFGTPSAPRPPCSSPHMQPIAHTQETHRRRLPNQRPKQRSPGNPSWPLRQHRGWPRQEQHGICNQGHGVYAGGGARYILSYPSGL